MKARGHTKYNISQCLVAQANLYSVDFIFIGQGRNCFFVTISTHTFSEEFLPK